MLLAGALSVPTAAWAQSDPQKAALAQTLFDEAAKDMEAKNFIDACPKLERVVALIPEGVGAKLELAKCYEGAGLLASAFGAYVGTEGAAIRANQPDRAQIARDRMDAIKSKIATLTLEVSSDIASTPGFSLKRDGIDVTATEYGLPLKLDKGEHVVIATATGRAPFEKRVVINDGDKQTLEIELGAASAPGEVPPKDKDVVAPRTEPPTTGGGETTFFTPLRIAGLAVGIAGVASAGAGIGIGMHAKSLYDDSNETGGCNADTNACASQSGLDLRDDAVMFGNVSTGLVIAGGVLAAGGIVMFVVAPSEQTTVGVGPGHLNLTTAF